MVIYQYAFVMFEHILIHDDKSTHFSLIGMYIHIHDNNATHIFHLYAGIFTYTMIIQFYSTISAFINIYMVITQWIITKYINIHGDISIFIISFHMYLCISLHIFIHYNCKNSFPSVTVVPETQIDKPDVDDGFELLLNRKQRRINHNIQRWETFKQVEFKTLASTSESETGK